MREPTSVPLCFKDLADAILTAVYDNCLPANKCSIIARQKQNRARNILGLS